MIPTAPRRPGQDPAAPVGHQARPPADLPGHGWSWAVRHGPALCLCLVLLTVVVLQVMRHPGLFDHDPPMLGPQENVRYELARQWVQDGAPVWHLSRAGGAARRRRTGADPSGRRAAGHDRGAQGLPVRRRALRAADADRPPSRRGLEHAVGAGAAGARGRTGPALGESLERGGRGRGRGRRAGAFAASTSGPLNTGGAVAAAVVTGVLLLLPRGPTSPGIGPAARPSPGRDVLAGARLRRRRPPAPRRRPARRRTRAALRPASAGRVGTGWTDRGWLHGRAAAGSRVLRLAQRVAVHHWLRPRRAPAGPSRGAVLRRRGPIRAC